MFPSWGNYGGPQSQNYGPPGPRKPPVGPGTGYGGMEAPSTGSLLSTLQEQHLQQMQQLQMLHQKQLQSVLQPNNASNTYGGLAGGYSGPSWHPEGSGHVDGGFGAQLHFNKPDEATTAPGMRAPPAPPQDQPQPPPPPQPNEPLPKPPPPESPAPKPPLNNGAPPAGEVNKKDTASAHDEKSRHLQEQQQLWYQKHLQNLQKLKQEKAKQNQKDGDISMQPPTHSHTAPPPPSEPPKGAPPPPPPKEEPPAPPPPPVEPEVQHDPEEAARLQQLQAAAAQWQQVQQQRAGIQYQALMQQHEKLQEILEKYQQLIQHPTNLQSMSTEAQLRHYEVQQQQFTPLIQDWDRSFVLWYEQFQSYPHKDQLQDYERQWKQWQEQMNATKGHLQERVATIRAMVPYASSQYNSGVMGQFAQYPGQDVQMQQHAANPALQQAPPSGAAAPGSQAPQSKDFGPHSEPPAAPPVIGNSPSSGIGVTPTANSTAQPLNFNSRGPRGITPRFDPPGQRFDGPPRFDQPGQRFDGPPRFDQPGQRFDGAPRFDQPGQRFDGPPRFNQSGQRFDTPPRFDQPGQRFDGPPRVNQPGQRFDGPQRFDQLGQRFDGPPRFDQPGQRFDGPQRFDQLGQRFSGAPRFDQPRQRFDGPPRFDPPRQRFDGPPRFDPPRQRFDGPPRFAPPPFEQSPRGSHPLRPPIPPSQFEHPAGPQDKEQQGLQPKTDSAIKQPTSTDSKTPVKSTEQSPASKDNVSVKEPDNMADDNMIGTGGFFIQNDPIPQTLKTKSEESNGNSTDKNDESKSASTKTTVTSAVASKDIGSQSAPKPDGLLTNKPSLDPKPPVTQQEAQASGPAQARLEPPRPPPGRGRGQPQVPLQGPGRGRGQRGRGDFRGPNNMPRGEDMNEMSYDYIPPTEDFRLQEDQQEYQWDDPSYEEFGGEESDAPHGQDMWVPEEHHFQSEEDYYEEQVGGPSVGRGGPAMRRAGPHMGRGGPPMGRGGFPFGRGGPPFGRGGPPGGRGGPPGGRGVPPGGRGGPPMGRGRPPMGRGGPHMGRGGLPLGRGEPVDRSWDGPETSEYSEEGDPYWEEWRPPVRGMRPPFPPGRGRPPRGHPSFMYPGRGRPPHPAHGPMDHEPLGPELETDDSEMDPMSHPMFHGRDPHGHPMPPDMGRGRRRVPPLHDGMDPMVEPSYDEGMEGEMAWHHAPRGRRPPAPHELMERGGVRRQPMGRGMGRGRPGPPNKEYEEEYREGYYKDYGHGEGNFGWRPPRDFPPEEFEREDPYSKREWDGERPLPERDFPPRMPPPERFRDEPWVEERERGGPYLYEEHDRGRVEPRPHEYRDEPPYRQEESAYPPPHSEWDRTSRYPPSPKRPCPQDYDERRPRYDYREQPPVALPPPPSQAAPVTNVPQSSVDPEPHGNSGAGVLALSQRQHEIILKAAQELKLIREMQEGKTVASEPQPAPPEIPSDLPRGLLGLEIPPEVRNALKGMVSTGQTDPASWDSKPTAADYQPPLPATSTPTVIPKTVDYGHGHELGGTVERISYGERIVLRPDPVPSDRGYEKESLGPRDPYGRDPYYERRSDPYMDRRDYNRERDVYRDRPPPDYERERERFDRDRYKSDRHPLGSHPRPSYRERDRDIRDREESGGRDRDDHFGRPGFDRPPYERTSLERSGSERYGHGSSPYMDRRSYPEDRVPVPPPSLPPPPQPPPRIEKKPEIKNIDDLLKPPGRLSRPERIVIIMRGLPGSGKSHVAKLIRDKEVDCGGAPPRVLVLDDYFMTEVEKVEKDPDTGKRVKRKVLVYEYELEMEETYRNSMLKTFKKTLDDGFFPFIIIDTINDKVKHFDQFWSAAKTKGFEVYVAEITADNQTCAKRNIHERTLKEVTKMSDHWEPSPRHMVRLDVRSLLQDAAIEEVEMEDFNPDDELKEPKREEEEEGEMGYIPKSKWEMDTSEAKLDKLDGLKIGGKRKREGEHMAGIEDYLQLPDDYATRMSEPGKKRVRWADLEEQKESDRKRAIGFVVGQTDWERITDESGQLAQRALNRTKYF
ncbi:uncharacterized protein ylpm1 isoform X2 [Genypterus blacodes]|uniref:uncharacterized protein ylpm1 isoform X2 n=1 Tax=Genypterus blacodes TaxID=154954 RepID=UPI003F777CC8